MKHLVKAQLPNSDMFISGLSIRAKTISYEVRDKITGKLILPVRTSSIELTSHKVRFDRIFIDLDFAKFADETLNSL